MKKLKFFTIAEFRAAKATLKEKYKGDRLKTGAIYGLYLRKQSVEVSLDLVARELTRQYPHGMAEVGPDEIPDAIESVCSEFIEMLKGKHETTAQNNLS